MRWPQKEPNEIPATPRPRRHPARGRRCTEVKINGEDLLIMKEADLMGVVEKTQVATKKAA